MAIHAALFLILLAVVFPFAPRLDAELHVTRAELIGDVDAWTQDPPIRNPLWQPEVPSQDPPPDPWDSKAIPKLRDPLEELSGQTLPTKPDLSIIGIGAGGADFSKYGLGVGDTGGAEFFGLGRSAPAARAIVYVVDRSGSMTHTFDIVLQELKRSVSALGRSQRFHVIFFSSGEPLENAPRRLVNAITAHKELLFKFMQNVAPGGATDPEPAMRRAFAVEPDLIYFLTDGEFSESLLPRLKEWNRNRDVRIFTIAFFGSEGAPLLERIAREHGGDFRVVTEADLP
jgi:hypothetical protein